jgi:hypothetical protein
MAKPAAQPAALDFSSTDPLNFTSVSSGSTTEMPAEMFPFTFDDVVGSGSGREELRERKKHKTGPRPLLVA